MKFDKNFDMHFSVVRVILLLLQVYFRQLYQYHSSHYKNTFTACCIPYLVDDNILHLPIFATLLLDLIVELLINLIRSDLGQTD